MSAPTPTQAIAEFEAEVDASIRAKDYKRLYQLADILAEHDYERACKLHDIAEALAEQASL